MLMTIFVVIALVAVGTYYTLSTPKTEEERKSTDEVKSVWQFFGLVDDTPNKIWAVVTGNEETGPIEGYISNVSGKKYDPLKKKMVPLALGEDPYAGEDPIATLIRELTGKRVFGKPFIHSLRPLGIDRVVTKETGVEPDPAKQLKSAFVRRYGLYGEIYRPTYHVDVDTKDGVRFNVYSYAIIEVEDPEPGFTIYKESLLQSASQIISAFLSGKIINMSWDDYKESRKTGLKLELGKLNKMLKPLGLKVTQLNLSDPQLSLSSLKVQEAVEKKKIAIETAAARREEGKGESDYEASVGKGKARAIASIAIAKAKRVTEYVAINKANGMNDKEAVIEANRMVEAEFNAEAISKLTGTYVAGGAGVNFNVNGGAKTP